MFCNMASLIRSPFFFPQIWEKYRQCWFCVGPCSADVAERYILLIDGFAGKFLAWLFPSVFQCRGIHIILMLQWVKNLCCFLLNLKIMSGTKFI